MQLCSPKIYALRQNLLRKISAYSFWLTEQEQNAMIKVQLIKIFLTKVKTSGFHMPTTHLVCVNEWVCMCV